MVRELENEFVKVGIKDHGAELSSFINKENYTEHIWQADASIWGRHAPILFPFVGQVKEGKYVFEGEEYHISQHGFARDMQFKIANQTNNSITYRITHDDETLAKYPFKFQLDVTYTLKEKTLDIKYNVTNSDTRTIWFSIGAHPGFNCPFKSTDSFNDYYLELNSEETSSRLEIENGLLSGKQSSFFNKESKIALEHDLFEQDAIIFEELNSSEICIKSSTNDQFVKMNFNNWPYLGIWTKPKANAPYVCLEPWHGITAESDKETILQDKKGIRSLDRGESFECNYTIEIG